MLGTYTVSSGLALLLGTPLHVSAHVLTSGVGHTSGV